MGIRNKSALLAFFSICSCGGGGSSNGQNTPNPPADGNVVSGGGSNVSTPNPLPSNTVYPSPLMNAANWEIGPVISGQNYSHGMPLHPIQTNEGWYFDFPIEGSVNYLTFKYGSLSSKSRITLRYRVEAELSVQFLPPCCAQLLGQGPTLYFQQKGDDWITDGKRWWATFNSPWPIVPGEHELVIPLDGPWTSVSSMTSQLNPDKFAAAKNNAERIGFTFGGGDGYGHGVYVTGPARFIVTDFRVE